MDASLLEILVCPVCKAKVEKKCSEIICKKCKLAYPIDEGIPVMLLGQARALEDNEQ